MMTSKTIKSIPRLIEHFKPPRCIKSTSTDKRPQLMEKFCQSHKLLSYPTLAPKNIGHVCGEKSYVLLGSLAKLERALMNWTMDELLSRHNFTPVVVPNIIFDSIIEKCGFPTKSDRSQVYHISGNSEESILEPKEINTTSDLDSELVKPCLAGTSEFALASMHLSDSIPFEDLPKRYCALSRCYRAETSNISSEWGLYRVKYFNKVEMFAFTTDDDSDNVHEEFLKIQRSLFEQLELEFKILDMPEDDLGLSASKKYDIEAWMPARQRFGEISSTSNCRDYQSSRLNTRFSKMFELNGQLQVSNNFVHTVNGTACSSIRTLIAIFEQHQSEDGSQVAIPKVLVPYMDGVESIPTEDDKRLLAQLDLYPEPKSSNK